MKKSKIYLALTLIGLMEMVGCVRRGLSPEEFLLLQIGKREWQEQEYLRLKNLEHQAFRQSLQAQEGEGLIKELVLKLKDPNWTVVKDAGEYLADNPALLDRVIDILLQELAEPGIHERWIAFRALRWLPDHPKTKPLLSDEVLCNIYELGASPWGWGAKGNCKSAAYTLGRLRDPRAIEPLKAARNYWGYDSEVTRSCDYALTMIEHWLKLIEAEKIQELTRIMENQDHAERVERYSAVRVLAKIKGPKAVELLIKALGGDEDYPVRCCAAWVLGEIGDKKAIPALLEALKNKENSVYGDDLRQAAAEALGKVKDESVVDSLIQLLRDKYVQKDNYEYWHSRRFAIYALGKVGDKRTIPILKKELKEWDYDVRAAAAQALGEIGSIDNAVLSELKKIAQKDKDKQVRQAAQQAIEKIQEKKAP